MHPALRGAIAAAALLALTPAGPARAAGAIEILAPAPGAILDANPLYLIGRSAGDAAVEVVHNGKRIRASTPRSQSFFTTLQLTAGANRIEIRSGSERSELSVTYRPGAPDGRYRYHDALDGGECEVCHPRGTAPVTRQEQALCYSCHDRVDEVRYLHGPVGAGQCTFCHDPHGSVRPFLLTAAEGKLCVRCHDQPGSREHLARSAGKPCEKCHDPHGSEKKFFLQ